MNRCVVCGKAFRGRSDKTYCSDQCRSSFHNQAKRAPQQYAKQVNAILQANRDQLAALCPTGKDKVAKSQLIDQGFSFGYFTGQYTTQAGATYFYCYDYGYRLLDEQTVLVVKLPEYVKQYLEQLVREDEPEYRKKG